MLPKSKRASRKDLSLLKKADITVSNSLFSLRAIKKDLQSSKISFSVSKKVSKSAVVRNRLRRFGYRSLRDIIDSIKNHIVILYFKKIPKDYEEVEKELKDILIKSKIIK